MALLDALLDQGVLIRVDDRPPSDQPRGSDQTEPSEDVEYQIAAAGAAWMRDFGIDSDALDSRRRPLVRYCLDWSEQRHHLAGALGNLLAARLFALDWLKPGRQGRIVTITDDGAAGLAAHFGIDLDPTHSARQSPRHAHGHEVVMLQRDV